jgi:hypothetical protein
MRKAPDNRIARWLTVVAFLLGSSWPALSQRHYDDVDPQLIRFNLARASLGVYVEGMAEDSHYQNGISSTYQRFFEGPMVGLALDGSIYHPDLLQYNLAGDFAVGWTQERTMTSGATIRRSEYDYIGSFTGNAFLLQNKPYRSELFAASGHTFREYDFFNHVLVDSFRYGLRSGYSDGPVPVNFTVAHLDEMTTGSDFNDSIQQTTINLDAYNERASGRTSMFYNFNDFTRTQGGSNASGTQNAVGLTDNERFGPRQMFEWRNAAAYTLRDFSEGSGDAVTAGSHLLVEHRDDLRSTYDFDYLRDTAEPATTERYDASAGVRHQLFSSLTSGLRLQAVHYDARGPGGEFVSTEYMGTWSESYTKRLSSSTRLTIGGSLGLSHTDQQSSSTAHIVGEAHTFGSGGPFLNSFYLNVPHADPASVEVFDAARTRRYTPNLDYSVTVLDQRTLIQLIQPNPSGLTPTTPVVVDYQAVPQGTGSIDGRFGDAQVRVDFFNGLLGVYGRYNDANYHPSSPEIIIENVSSVAFGVDVTWNWLRAGGEYEIYDSTFTSYSAARFFQSLSFLPDEASSLSFSLNEGWTDYGRSRQFEQYYSTIGRYHRGVTSHLGVDLEAGFSYRTGFLVNELLAAVRPGVTYNIGKLSMKAGYDFEYQNTQNNQERKRQTFFLRAQRDL